jgi:NAD(P)-dependent dehydrogenase (short-subunit alcohol dehydrogenase family)
LVDSKEKGMISLAGKNVLITGGASGIGLGLAKVLGRNGAKLALASTNRDKIDKAVAALEATGVEAIGIELDVADPAQWSAAADKVERLLGPIGFLALNAGVAPPPATVATTALSVWEWSLGVNLWGVIHGLHTCLPRMQAHGQQAHILITSSIAAFNSKPTMGAYVAAKAGVVQIAEVLRAELDGGPIGVSILAPAAVRTDIVATSKGHTPVGNDRGYAAINAVLSEGLDPIVVAEYTVARIRDGHFYIFTHDQQREAISHRFSEIIASMQTSA